MKKKLFCFSLCAMLLLCTSVAFGAEALYYVDYPSGTDKLEVALEDESLGLNVTYAVDSSDFAAQIASQDWDLVVLAIQNNYAGGLFSSFSDSGLDEYVNDGGSAVFCYFRSSDLDNVDVDFYSFFGAAVTGNTNDPSVVVSGPLAEGLASNPLTLTNSDWIIYSLGLAALSTEDIVAGTFSNNDPAIIISNEGRTIINGFLTDTPPDETLYVNEIKYVLDPPAITTDNGDGGCNISAVIPSGLILLAPLVLLLKKFR